MASSGLCTAWANHQGVSTTRTHQPRGHQMYFLCKVEEDWNRSVIVIYFSDKHLLSPTESYPELKRIKQIKVELPQLKWQGRAHRSLKLLQLPRTRYGTHCTPCSVRKLPAPELRNELGHPWVLADLLWPLLQAGLAQSKEFMAKNSLARMAQRVLEGEEGSRGQRYNLIWENERVQMRAIKESRLSCRQQRAERGSLL